MLSVFSKYVHFSIPIFILGVSLLIAEEDGQKKNKTIKVQNDKWLAIDKVQHFSYSCFVSLGAQYMFVNKLEMDEKNALPFSSLLSLSAGTLKEMNDKRGGSYFSFKDMVANGLGIVFAGIIISIQN